MDKRVFAPNILTLSPQVADSWLERFEGLGIKCYSLRLSRTTGGIFRSRLLKQFLREHPADIIHASDLRSSIVAAMGPKNIPRIITRRQPSFKYLLGYEGIIPRYILDAIYSEACHRVDKVIGVSRFVREAAGRRLKSHMEVILNGVDTEKFKPASIGERTQLRTRFCLPQEKRVFIAMGWLNEGKDPLNTIEGFLSSKVGEQSMLLLIGDGPLCRKCKRLANGHSNVRFVGFVNNVVEYLQSSDFVVSSSLSEGCPNGILEALACGLPMILSDIGPHNEIMKFNDQAGFLFPVKDVCALAKRIEEANKADYSLLRKSALSIVQKHLNAQKMSLQYQELYRGLCESHTKCGEKAN